MKKYITLVLLMIWGLQNAQERYYIDKSGNRVEKEKAQLYREIQKKDDLYHIKDYYLSGQLQMEGFSKVEKVERLTDLEGKFVFYHENGQVESSGEMQDGKPLNEIRQFDDKGRLIYVEYIKPEGGYRRERYVHKTPKNPQTLLYIIEDYSENKQIVYDEDITKIRYEEVYQDSIRKTSYYGNDGKLIGELITNTMGVLQGVMVDYYYNPMRVKNILQFSTEGKFTSGEIYYPDGNLFSKQNNNTATYYDQKGKKIGEVSFTRKNNDIEYHNGTAFDLNEQGVLHQKTEYKFNMPHISMGFYANGKVKNILKYTLEGTPDKATFYNDKGKIISEANYYENNPYEGIFYLDLEKNNSAISFHEGKITLQEMYDNEQTLRFRRKLISENPLHYQCEVFDNKGVKTYDYVSEIDENIYRITQYKNGKPHQTAVIRDNILSEGSFSYIIKDEEKEKRVTVNVSDGWVTNQYYQGEELVKEVRIKASAFEVSAPFEILFSEKFLSEYGDMSNF